MNKNIFNEIICQLADSEHISERRVLLEKAIRSYPYASLLYIASARMTNREEGVAFEEAMEAAMCRISDPQILFQKESIKTDGDAMPLNIPAQEENSDHLAPVSPDPDIVEAIENDSLDQEEVVNIEEQHQAKEEEELVREEIVLEEPFGLLEEVVEKIDDLSDEMEVSAEGQHVENNTANVEETVPVVKLEEVDMASKTQIAEQTEMSIETAVDGEELKVGISTESLFSSFAEESKLIQISSERDDLSNDNLLSEVRSMMVEFKKYEKKCLKKLLKELKNSSEKPDKKKTEELKQLRKLRKKRITRNREVISDILLKAEYRFDRFEIEDFRKLFTAFLENFSERDKKYKKIKQKKGGHEKLKSTSPAESAVQRVVRQPPSVPKRLLNRATTTYPPSIREESRPDLSLSSVKLNEELISENLAKILTKQGKSEQALAMYRKLSLKYPEKSTYFAEIIEKLEQD